MSAKDILNHLPTDTNKRLPKNILIGSFMIAAFLGFKIYQNYVIKKNSPKPIDYNDYISIITTSAPGKIILTGEHAVVYGITAISTAINKKTSITIYEPKQANHMDSKIILKLNEAELSWNINNLINIHSKNNALNTNIICKEYDNNNVLIKPEIIFTVNDVKKLQIHHPLYSQNNWDKQLSLVLLSLLFCDKFIKLFTNKQFITSGILIDVKSNIPIGAGLGSSAAWSTSLSGAIYYYYHYIITHQKRDKIYEMDSKSMREIWNLSYDLEKIHHGTPSGIDNTTSLYGGYIKFKNKTNFEVIDVKKQFIHAIPLLVINTNVIGNTKLLVQNVRELHSKYSVILDGIFESIEQIGQNVIDNLINKNIVKKILAQNINELFALNHGLLLSVGVGHDVINQVQNICHQYGFNNGFKITGAGGGGCVIIPLLSKYCNDDIQNDNDVDKVIENFRHSLLNKGYESYLIQTGQNGLCLQFH